MYPNAALTRYLNSTDEAARVEWAFGARMGAGYYATDIWSVGNILLRHVLYTKPQLLTADPQLADLFIVPLVPESSNYGFIERPSAPGRDPAHALVAPLCKTLWDEDLSRVYAHLNPATAAKHLFLVSNFNPIWAICQISGFGGREPRSMRLIERTRIIIHEDFGRPEHAPAFYTPYRVWTGQRRGTLSVNAPFPSAIHSARKLREVLTGQGRPYLMSFAGSLRGSTEGSALRAAIDRQCFRLGEPTCKRLQFSGGVDLASETMARTYRLYRQSRFCLSPGGFNVIRKGVVDALVNGCIPVVFVRVEVLSQLWPWHWWWWRANASVNFEPTTFLAGQVELAATLGEQSYPPVRLAAMQAVMARHMHSLCYLQPPRHGSRAATQWRGADATDLLLEGLAFGLPADGTARGTNADAGRLMRHGSMRLDTPSWASLRHV